MAAEEIDGGSFVVGGLIELYLEKHKLVFNYIERLGSF